MVDLSKLSMGALRRYQAWFKLEIPNSVKDKEEVLSYIQKHFDDMKVEPAVVMDNLLKIKKDIKPEDHLFKKERHEKKPLQGSGAMIGYSKYSHAK